MRPDPAVRPEYLAAVAEIVRRIGSTIRVSARPVRGAPVRMFIAGGAAVHLYTANRVTEDIDAVFSHRVLLPEDLEVVYAGEDGRARLVYFDRQYNDTFGLLHEDAHAASLEIQLPGVDPRVIQPRLLAPVDLAVTKLGRYGTNDQDDLAALARRSLLRAGALRKRALEALGGYVGDHSRVRNSLDLACKLIERERPGGHKSRRPAARRKKNPPG